MPNHYQIEIPYNLTPDEVAMEPDQDTPGPVQQYMKVLEDLSDEGFDLTKHPDMAADKVCERICRSAVILYKKFPERSFADCLRTAMVWEFG